MRTLKQIREQTESINEGASVWGADFDGEKGDEAPGFPQGNVLNLEKGVRGEMKGDIFTIRIKTKSYTDASDWIQHELQADPHDAYKNFRELQLGGPIDGDNVGSDGVWGSDKKGKWVIMMGTKRMLQKVLKGESGIKRSDYPGIL